MEYLVHEYTWSSRGIRQGGLGWGIKASASPDDRQLLGELEKLAAKVEPDRNHKMPVIQLTYSPKCGFVLMRAMTADPGEDNRENKLVSIYQPGDDKTCDPAIYMAPAFSEADFCDENAVDENGRLPLVKMEAIDQDPAGAFVQMQLVSRLPELLKAVYWCLLESQQGLNVVCDWAPETFRDRTARLMYAIHKLLPESLRKKAGYLSFTEENIAGVSFFFSDKPLNKKAFDLAMARLPESDEDLMYEDMALSIVSEDGFYDRFAAKASDYLEASAGKSNMLMRLFWIYYSMAVSENRPVAGRVKTDMIRSYVPQLMFWSKNDPYMKEVLSLILPMVSVKEEGTEVSVPYLGTLIQGYTMRAGEEICEEIDQVLDHIGDLDPEEADRQIESMKTGHGNVYSAWITHCHEKENSRSRDIYTEALKSFEGISGLVKQLQTVSENMKKDILVAGIGLVNRDIFKLGSYVEMDDIVGRLKCERQWGEILKGFLEALEKKTDSLDDEKLDVAVSIEKMTAGYLKPEGLQKMHFADEQERRKVLTQMPALKEEKLETVAYDAQYTNAERRVRQETRNSAHFIMESIPQGFVTGCLMYLSWYTLNIGHWKIALGALGMWLIVMLNYIYTNLHKKKPEEWWKCIGLCLVEGFLIYLCGKYLIPANGMLIYFGILGVLTIAVAVVNLMIKIKTGGHDHGNAS